MKLAKCFGGTEIYIFPVATKNFLHSSSYTACQTFKFREQEENTNLFQYFWLINFCTIDEELCSLHPLVLRIVQIHKEGSSWSDWGWQNISEGLKCRFSKNIDKEISKSILLWKSLNKVITLITVFSGLVIKSLEPNRVVRTPYREGTCLNSWYFNK